MSPGVTRRITAIRSPERFFGRSHGQKGRREGCGNHSQALRPSARARIAQGAQLVALGVYAAQCGRLPESSRLSRLAEKQLDAPGRQLLGHGGGAGIYSSSKERKQIMSSVVEKFRTMEYGPAPEDPKESLAWLDGHNRRFGHFIGGARPPPSGRK